MNLELIKSSASRYLGRGIYQVIELRHSGFSQEWNLINAGSRTPINIDGTEYESLPFALTLSSQGESASSTVAIANIDRRIAEEISNAVDNEDIQVSTYLAHLESNNGDVVGELYPKGVYTVSSCEVTQDAIALGLAIKSSLGFNISSLRFSKNNFNNLYL